MVNNRFFLGSVAFGVSFAISLVTGRDLGRAILTGATTVPAAIVAAIVVDRRSQHQAEARIETLKFHIRALQQRRMEAYQQLVEIEAEKERLGLSLSSSSSQWIQPQLAPAPRPGRQILSWDLSAPATVSERRPALAARAYELPTQVQSAGPGILAHELPTQFQSQPPSPAQELPTQMQPLGQPKTSPTSPEQLSLELEQSRIEAIAQRRKLEASLLTVQAELDQLNQQISDQRQSKEKLARELSDLKSQKRKLEAEATSLRAEVKDLENCRVEMEQYLTYAETRKRELEVSTNPLQATLKQLQTQVAGLQTELTDLETQVAARHKQKAELETQLANLKIPVVPGDGLTPVPAAKTASSPSGNGSRTSGTAQTQTLAAPAATVAPSIARPVKPANREVAKSDRPGSDLGQDWTELMVQMPEYELQVLRSLVEHNNPAGVIKRIAEANLTMPEMLIDSINERALDTVGDIIIEPGEGSTPATVARDHLKAVKKLIKTYDYLNT